MWILDKAGKVAEKKIKEDEAHCSFHSHPELACMCANVREIRIKSLMEMLPLGRKMSGCERS